MTLTIYFIILTYFVIGGTGFYFINRNKDKMATRGSWLKFITYFFIIHILFLAIFVISYLVAFFRFGKIPGLHLYSAVSAGYLQGVFFFCALRMGFQPLVLLYCSRLWRTGIYREKPGAP